VVLEENSHGEFICLYDFIVQMGHLSERLAKDLTHTLLTFIEFIEGKGFKSCFNPNDILIEKATGQIKIDNYGDSQHFITKDETSSDVWELGSFLFTLLKGNPPYNRKAQSDHHFNCLDKGLFQRFWELIPDKPVKNPS
jgi:serine/threonine protein kinase